MATCRRKKIDPYSQPYTKFNFKWISTRPNTLNLTAEKGENGLELTGIEGTF